MTGAELIAAERERQIEVLGNTQEKDQIYDHQELLSAAVAYACVNLNSVEHSSSSDWALLGWWPWETSFWKPSDDAIRNLVKAGALIAAEIDRLQS